MALKNRWDFLNAMRFIYNEPTSDVNQKLKNIEATLMSFQLGMGQFYKGFVKDKHFFL